MRLILCLLLALSSAARAAEVTDATGRTVRVPDHVARILPAGPPAAVLLFALAPDLMLGFPNDVSPEARAVLGPTAAALPRVPRLTGKQDVTEQVRALKPDLIVDYGDVSPDYAALARTTQDRLGVPTLLLDGSLAATPRILRLLGTALHREARAEALASLAERVLASSSNGLPSRSVVYLRGTEALRAMAPDVGAAEVFALLHLKVLAPAGNGSFRPVTRAEVAALDPDVLVFGDARMRNVVAASADWRALRAVREGHAFTDPALPFGWIEEPPSVNRLFGVLWLSKMLGDRKALVEMSGLLCRELFACSPPGAAGGLSQTIVERLDPLPP